MQQRGNKYRDDDDKLALLDDGVTLERAYYEIHRRHFAGRAAASTVEALMLGLRSRGVVALKEAPAQQRLGALSPEQLHDVIARLIRLRSQYPKITDALLLQLEELLP